MAFFPECAQRGFARTDFDGVIFDFDGTLADSMHVWTDIDQKFCDEYDLGSLDAIREGILGLGFEATAEYFINTLGVTLTVEECCAEFNRLAREEYRTSVLLKPGVKEYLDVLDARGVPYCLATSLNRMLLELALENNGVTHRFTKIFLCDEHQTHKTEPLIYQIAAAGMGVDPARCLVFEDISPALKSAHAAGAFTVGVLDPANGAQKGDEVKLLADATISNYAELLDCVVSF